MQRRRFGSEFRIEAVRLVRKRGVSVAQTAWDLEVHENVLRKWVKEFVADPVHALPGHGQMKPEQLEIDRLNRVPSNRARDDEEISAKVRASFIASARTYDARRVWHDVLAEGFNCGLHKIERLMQAQAFRARPRRRGLPKDEGQRLTSVIAPNVLDRAFSADRPNRK